MEIRENIEQNNNCPEGQVSRGASLQRGESPEGRVSRGASLQRGESPEGRVSRGASLQGGESPEGRVSRGASLQRGESPEGQVSRGASLQRGESPEGRVSRGASLQGGESPERRVSRGASLRRGESPEGQVSRGASHWFCSIFSLINHTTQLGTTINQRCREFMGAEDDCAVLCVRKKVMVYQSVNVSKCFSFALPKYAYTKVSHGHGGLFGVPELVKFQPFLSKCCVQHRV